MHGRQQVWLVKCGATGRASKVAAGHCTLAGRVLTTTVSAASQQSCAMHSNTQLLGTSP
jgi:hypothetical protein